MVVTGVPVYIVIRRKRRGEEVKVVKDGQVYLRGAGSSTATVAQELGELLVKLGKARVEYRDVETEYVVDDEMFPYVVTYMLLVRRSREAKKWLPVVEGLVEGKYPGLPEALARMVDAVIEASRRFPVEARRVKTVIHPRVADAFTAGVKRFVEKYVKSLG